MLAILHHISDSEDPAAIAARFRDALAPGSYPAISSFRMPGAEHPEDAAKTRAVQDLPPCPRTNSSASGLTSTRTTALRNPPLNRVTPHPACQAWITTPSSG